MPYPPNIAQLVNNLFHRAEGQGPSRIYSILDAARDEVIYQKISKSDIKSLSLYQGDKAVDLADVAPYLIYLEEDKPFCEWLLTKGWGNSWGIFLESSSSPEQLRNHFRKFLTVYDEDGNPLYFRYYDPRVLRVYLPTCNAEELEIIFGPVNRYCLENKDRNLTEFRCTDKFELIQNVMIL
ncbi:MAG: DUF4123 domain-containing protein [Nitrospirota bacterium]